MADVKSHQRSSPDHLLVRVGKRIYGIPAWRILRVVASRTINPVPGTKGTLIGLTRLGGEPIVVLSGEGLVSGSPAKWKPKSPIVFVQIGAANRLDTVGLAITEALDVVRITQAMWKAKREETPFSTGQTVLDDGRVIFCLELDRMGVEERGAQEGEMRNEI
ncbi:MAG: chemotaxis protein CheW [Thermoanaerobaculales bacterium]|nr:chemotaxis protein CheW [Thermoanaerobaculales bacterium]